MPKPYGTVVLEGYQTNETISWLKDWRIIGIPTGHDPKAAVREAKVIGYIKLPIKHKVIDRTNQIYADYYYTDNPNLETITIVRIKVEDPIKGLIIHWGWQACSEDEFQQILEMIEQQPNVIKTYDSTKTKGQVLQDLIESGIIYEYKYKIAPSKPKEPEKPEEPEEKEETTEESTIPTFYFTPPAEEKEEPKTGAPFNIPTWMIIAGIAAIVVIVLLIKFK